MALKDVVPKVPSETDVKNSPEIIDAAKQLDYYLTNNMCQGGWSEGAVGLGLEYECTFFTGSTEGLDYALLKRMEMALRYRGWKSVSITRDNDDDNEVRYNVRISMCEYYVEGPIGCMGMMGQDGADIIGQLADEAVKYHHGDPNSPKLEPFVQARIVEMVRKRLSDKNTSDSLADRHF